ncbi:MAG: hypothetical protein ABR584_09760 [Candidatus Baltobacteraceae bacterium]
MKIPIFVVEEFDVIVGQVAIVPGETDALFEFILRQRKAKYARGRESDPSGFGSERLWGAGARR